ISEKCPVYPCRIVILKIEGKKNNSRAGWARREPQVYRETRARQSAGFFHWWAARNRVRLQRCSQRVRQTKAGLAERLGDTRRGHAGASGRRTRVRCIGWVTGDLELPMQRPRTVERWQNWRGSKSRQQRSSRNETWGQQETWKSAEAEVGSEEESAPGATERAGAGGQNTDRELQVSDEGQL